MAGLNGIKIHLSPEQKRELRKKIQEKYKNRTMPESIGILTMVLNKKILVKHLNYEKPKLNWFEKYIYRKKTEDNKEMEELSLVEQTLGKGHILEGYDIKELL